MKAALLPDRGVVKVAGSDARGLLNGLLTADIGTMTLPDTALCRATDPARQDHRRLHCSGSLGRGRRRLLARLPRALAEDLSENSISTSCAPKWL